MNEQENLLDLNNYKILIQIKKNRRLKRKTKFLTPDFTFSENENEAFEFENLLQAEFYLTYANRIKNLPSRPRIFIKYIGE